MVILQQEKKQARTILLPVDIQGKELHERFSAFGN